MIITKPITSDNIELKSLNEADVTDVYVSWLNDCEITKHTEIRHAIHTLQGTKDFVRKCNISSSVLLLGVFCKNLHIGNIKTDINHEYKTAGVGLIIGDKAFHGQGIGTRIIDKLSNHLFSSYDVYKINAGAYASNISSIKAFQKSGFDIEYTKYKHVINSVGDREDVIMMVRYAS